MYLDSYVLRHICNNKLFFLDLRLKSYEFVTAKGKIIRSNEIDIIYLSNRNGVIITFINVAYTPKCNSNFILLGQLQESGITYYKHLNYMILKQRDNTIGLASRLKNFFILDTKTVKKMIIIQKKR